MIHGQTVTNYNKIERGKDKWSKMQKGIRVYSKWEKQKKNNINAGDICAMVSAFQQSLSFLVYWREDFRIHTCYRQQLPALQTYFSSISMFYIYSIVVINHLCQPDNYITAWNLFEAFVQLLHDKIKNKGNPFRQFWNFKTTNSFFSKITI